MKSTAVDESLSSMNQQFCSRENQLLQMLQQNEKSTHKKKSLFLFIKIPDDSITSNLIFLLVLSFLFFKSWVSPHVM